MFENGGKYLATPPKATAQFLERIHPQATEAIIGHLEECGGRWRGPRPLAGRLLLFITDWLWATVAVND